MNVYEDYLQHHGILGMKWGVRRYRNEDGSLTDKGKKRYDYELRRNGAKKKANRLDEDALKDPARWDEEDTSSAKNLAESTRLFSRSLEDVDTALLRLTTRTKRTDLSGMTDEEMRKKINRELLERQYDQVFNTKQVSLGRARVSDILSLSTATLGTISTGLGIALAIKQLRKP